jgi:hypothetical protein
MKFTSKHSVKDFDRSFSIHSKSSHYIVFTKKSSVLIFELRADDSLCFVKELDIGSSVINVEAENETAIFCSEHGIAMYSIASWEFVNEINFDLKLSAMKRIKTKSNGSVLILLLQKEGRSSVLILEELQIKTKIDFKDEISNFIADSDG